MKSSSPWMNHLVLWLAYMLLRLPISWQALSEASSKGPQPWELEDAYRTIEYNQDSAPLIKTLLSTKTTAAAKEPPSASSSKEKVTTNLSLQIKTKHKGQVTERGKGGEPHHVQARAKLPLYANLAESWHKEYYLRYTSKEATANTILRENLNLKGFELVREFTASFSLFPEKTADLIQAVFKYLLTKESTSQFESLIWFDLLAKVTLAGAPTSLNQEAEAALQQGLISFLAKMKTDTTFLRTEDEYEPAKHLPRICVENFAEALLSITRTRWTESFTHLGAAIEHIPFAQETIFPQLGLSKPLRNVNSFINLIKFDEKLSGLLEALQKPNVPLELHVTVIRTISRMATIHAATSAQTKTASIVLLYYIKHGLIDKIDGPIKELASQELSKFESHEAGKILLSHDDTLIRHYLKQNSPKKSKKVSLFEFQFATRGKILDKVKFSNV